MPKQSQAQKERSVLLARRDRVTSLIEPLKAEVTAIDLLLKGQAVADAQKHLGIKASGPKAKKPAKAKPKAKAKKPAKAKPKAKAKRTYRAQPPAEPTAAATEAQASSEQTSTAPETAQARKTRAKKGEPGLRENLQKVIGQKQCTAVECHGYLRELGLLPNSDDPLSYIRFTLSKEKNLFQRVDGQRGVYELEPSNPYYQMNFAVPELPKEDEDEAAEATAEAAPTPPPVVVAPVVAAPVAAKPKPNKPITVPPPAAAKPTPVAPPAPAPSPAAKPSNGGSKPVAAKPAEPAPAEEAPIEKLEGEALEEVVDGIISAGGKGTFSTDIK
jgi:hypothetical protein